MNSLAEFKSEYPEYKVALAVVCGSWSHGWASPNSDADIHGIYMARTEDYMGLDTHFPKDTIQRKFEKYNAEFQMYEIGKFVSLLITPNLNMMDILFVPESHILEQDKELLKKLKELANYSLSKKCYPHVQGLTIHMRKHRQKNDPRDPKKNLNIFREQMRGIVLFEEERLVNNIQELSEILPEYKAVVDMLLERKYQEILLTDDEIVQVKKQELAMESRMLVAKEFGILRDRPIDHLEKEAQKLLMNVRKENYTLKR